MRSRAIEVVGTFSRPCIPSNRHILSTSFARRSIQITATPSIHETQQSADKTTSSAEARFEILGSPYSLLSASISPSQNLYTRKGALVGFEGQPENAVSTLSLLAPFRRALSGVPFIYQRIQSTTPYTALIATRSSLTSLAVVHLDGRLDWMILQRDAILAWTGHTLSLTPRVNASMGVAHWGTTHVTGRGLIALSGKGVIHQIALKTGEEYVVHPGNILAYSLMQHLPQPYRFKANILRFQIPSPSSWVPDTRFWRTMRETKTWIFIRDSLFLIRTWARRVIWGDRLFLRFQGPCKLLVQSRASQLRDVLSSRDVNEIAGTPAGAVSSALSKPSNGFDRVQVQPIQPTTTFSYASVDRGAVKFEEKKL